MRSLSLLPLPVSCPPPKEVDLLAMNLSHELPDSMHFRDNLLLAAGGYSIRGKSLPTNVAENSLILRHGTEGLPPDDNNYDAEDSARPGPNTSEKALTQSPPRHTRASRIEKKSRMSCNIE